MKIYIVQKGDTLYEIANKHGVTLADLEKMNPQLKNPDKIMPGMKIKVPTGSVAVKKKEFPIKKEVPIKKEMPVKKEVPIKKEVPVKEVPVKKMPVEVKPVEKKPIEEKPVEKKPVAEKPVEKKPVEKKPIQGKLKEPIINKMAPKKMKEPIFKETKKPVEEANKVKFKDSNVLAPALPLKDNEMVKDLVMEKKSDIPMMDDAFPNMITPKKPEEVPTWQYPFSTYGGTSQVPPYYQGMPSQAGSTGYGGYTMPATYQPGLGAQSVEPGTYGGYAMPGMTSPYQPEMSVETGEHGSYGGYTMPGTAPTFQSEMGTETTDPWSYGGYTVPGMSPSLYPSVMGTETGEPGSYGGYTMPGMPPTYQLGMSPQTGSSGVYGGYMSSYPSVVGAPDPGAYGAYTAPSTYQPGITAGESDQTAYGYSMMPTAYQGSMPTYQTSPCGCGGHTGYESGYYIPTQMQSGVYPSYGMTGYGVPPTTPTYYRGVYPQATDAQANGSAYPMYSTYSQSGMPGYSMGGFKPTDYGNQTTQAYQPDFPKWGDDDKD